MTRAQRRKLFRLNQKAMRKNKGANATTEASECDFSDVPLATLCQSIMLLVEELKNRGKPLRDFDNKDKYIQSIQIIKNEVYFMAAGENIDEN